MAGVIAGLCANGTTVLDSDCTAVSYPDFLAEIARLRK
jgi:5-enolpyruvylshikimate-3-phosphate synthase